MNDNGKFRKRNGYTTTGNTLTRDPSISLKAKGLYLVIMSYITLPNLELTKNFIFKQCKEGEKGFESSWNELKEAGYLKVYFLPTKNGFQAEYELLDEPAEGPHTFYLDIHGNIKSTNIDRKNKKDSQMQQSSNIDLSISNKDSKHVKNTENDRCPHFGGNAVSSDFDRYPQKSSNAFGSNAKGGNNINTINKPLNNNNNLSIYPNTDVEDGLMETNKNINNSEQVIIYEYASDIKKMNTIIKDLVDYDIYANNTSYSELEQSTHNLIIECLIEMATDKKVRNYYGSSVTYVNVIDKINEVCEHGELAPLHFWVEMTMEDYIQAAKNTEIKNIKAYMKSCIWNSFFTYKIKWQSFFERTYSNL